MSSASITHPTADHLDIVNTALATVSRRLPTHVSREDLASAGKVALVAALGSCASGSAAEEVRAYCFVRVRGAMLDELRRLDPLSRRQREKSDAVVRAQAELSARLGRAPSRAEIAVATQLSLVEVLAAQKAATEVSEYAESSWEHLADEVAPSPAEAVETEDLRASLRTALTRLTSVQACVVYRYYFEDATLDEIAGQIGVSKERVRQIRDAAEKKLRADFVVLALWQSLLVSP